MKQRGLEVLAAVVVLGLTLWMILSTQSRETPVQQTHRHWKTQLTAVQIGQASGIDLPDVNLPVEKLDDLRSVADHITTLNLSGENLAQGIDRIAALTRLKVLHLRTRVGDREVRELAQLPDLEVLDLPLALDLTDSGLAVLEQHPKLKLLRLRAPKVTDAGLQTLKAMPALKWVHLMEVPLTDAGLTVFRELPQLESLYLDADRATDEGLSQLVQARPDLHFHRDQVHLESDPRGQDGHRD